ncbi:MAG: glycosyltransferase [Gallionellaceae bacterium]
MIAAIIVTFNPHEVPMDLVTALQDHCEVVIADNSTHVANQSSLRAWSRTQSIRYISMSGNMGIAAAQNRGLHEARSVGARGVVFFDQDSLVNDLAISSLVKAVNENADIVFCLQPGMHDDVSPIRNGLGVRELMSSGSGCQLSVFDRVGDFESELFIDCVDFEWGWRCIRDGLSIRGIQRGDFLHRLGEREINIFQFSAHISSPIRGYYQYRNIITMFGRSYVPTSWKILQGFRSFAKLLIIGVLLPDRLVRFKFISQGVRDGLRGHLGPYSYAPYQS